MKLRKWSKVVLFAMTAVFLLAAFPACSDGSDNGGGNYPRIVAQYGSEDEGAQMTFYSNQTFTLAEDDARAVTTARALVVTITGMYTGNPMVAGTVECIATDNTIITVTVSEDGITVVIDDGELYELTPTVNSGGFGGGGSPSSGKSYTVTFKSDTGETLATKTVKEGDAVSAPQVDRPTGMGNRFLTWVDANENVFVLTTPITEDITLTAKWQEAPAYLIVSGDATVTGYRDAGFPTDGVVEIPEGITEIGLEAFENCTLLTSVNIPDGVTKIGSYAFMNCTMLTSVKIPDTVTEIKNSAFNGCESLTSVDIPDGVTKIDHDTFNGCTSLKTVTIGSGVTSIEQYAFIQCSALTRVEIPGNVATIGEDAFAQCKGLERVIIRDGVTTIGVNAFFVCRALTSVEIPRSVTRIERGAFGDSDNLDVYYVGTEQEWNRIIKEDTSFSKSAAFYCGSTMPAN